MNDAHSLSAALHAGLTALKRRDYVTAVAQLEAVRQSTPDAASRAKAEMGLVRAYARTGRQTAAIELCRQLQQHRHPQVQAWATQTLAALTPVPDSAESRASLDASSEPTHDQTGFVPLASEPPRLGHRAGRVPPGTVVPIPSSRSRVAGSAKPQAAISQPPLEPMIPDSSPQSVDAPPKAAIEPLESPLANSPAAPPEPNPATTELLPPRNLWRQAGRVQKWTTLGPVDASPLWALQVGTVIAWFWWATTLVSGLQAGWNRIVLSLPFPISLRGLVIRTDLTWFVVLLGLGLALASPWVVDRLLRRLLQPFSLEELEQYSPEAVRLLKRVFGRRQPILRLLSSDAPLALTYGWLPQAPRLVVSQGALQQLSAEELATLYAAELGHLRYKTAQILSSLAMVTQLPYQAYRQIAAWGDRQHDRVLQSLAVIGSSFSYGTYWLLRLPLLGLSRIRHYYSDRIASELTGNPNALIRTELKLSLGMSEATQRQQASDPLLESLDLLLPVSYRAALSLGSVYSQQPTPNLLEWDRRHPCRAWLALNQSHPPLGQRLHWLTHYARHWRLEAELDWASLLASSTASGPLTRQFLLQAAPFLGIPIGVAVALGLWGIGWLALRLRWLELGWLWGDPSLLWGGGLLGFSMGTMLRINPFFPDIHQAAPRPLDLAGLLSQKHALPVDSQPGCWQGQLLGRPGFANWLYSDLMLHTPTGTIRLHFTTRCGVVSNLLPQRLRPTALLGQTVTVTGWLRRGVTPWIDVETLRTTRGTIRSHHPVASTVLAIAAALLGLAIILRG